MSAADHQPGPALRAVEAALLGRRQRTGDEAMVREVLRLELSHEKLKTALQWLVDNNGECLGDHPKLFATVRSFLVEAP